MPDRARVPPISGWILRDVIVPFVLTRAALAVIATVAAANVPPGVACDPCDLSSVPLVNALSRWDGGAYLEIARDGYSHTPDAGSNVTFSPLLPILMRGLAALTGRADDDRLLAAGLVISNVSLVVGLVYLVGLGRLEVGIDAGRRAAVYVLVFPTTVFLSAVYPESLFLALATGTLFEARRSRWRRAGALASLAALARPFGMLLVLPLAAEALVQRRRGTAIGATTLAVALSAPVTAFLAWQLFLYASTGDPLAFLTAQASYGRRPSGPWEAVVGLGDPSLYSFPWLVLAMFVGSVVLVVSSWLMLSPSTAVYGTTMLIAMASSGTLSSFPRYALTLAPGCLALGALGRRRPIHLASVAISTALAGLLTAMFAAWYWVG